MCPSLIEIGSKTAEKNSAQTNKQTDTTKIMVIWPWTKKAALLLFLVTVQQATIKRNCVDVQMKEMVQI